MIAVIPDSFYSRHHSGLDLESHRDNSTLCVPILHKISEGILNDNRCNDLCADRGDEKITSCKIEAEEIGWCCRYDEFCSETKAGDVFRVMGVYLYVL